MTKEVINLIKSAIFEDKELTEAQLDKISRNSATYESVCDFEDFKNPKLVRLPNDNIGHIFVEKEFVKIAKKVNDLTNKLYKHSNELAGWEYFSTIAAAIDMNYIEVACL